MFVHEKLWFAFFSIYFYKFFQVIYAHGVNSHMMGERYISLNLSGKNMKRKYVLKFSNQRRASTVGGSPLINLLLMLGNGEKYLLVSLIFRIYITVMKNIS